MRRQQSGFTLIELIAVIVILGALAVVALPRFIDLQQEADQAATEGVAGSLGSGTAVNLAGALAGETSANLTTVTNCNNAPATLGSGTLPSTSYSVPAQTISNTTTGAAATCTLNGPSGTSAEFTGYAVPNP